MATEASVTISRPVATRVRIVSDPNPVPQFGLWMSCDVSVTPGNPCVTENMRD